MIESPVQVVKTIGIPSIVEGNPKIDMTPEALHSASINKIKLFYLESLAKSGKIDYRNSELRALREQYQKLLKLVCFLGKLFKENGVSYAIMKTLRPFPYSGADVDVIVETQKGFSSALRVLQERNFQLLGHDLYSATLFHKDYELNVDLQLEVSVSGLPYLWKTAVLSHVIDYPINGTTVNALNPCSEVIVVACHSFYKEHMYVLSDFYTTVMSVTKDNSDELCVLAKKANCVAAVSAMLAWTQRVASEVFKIELQNISNVLSVLDNEPLGGMLGRLSLEFPLKFPKSFVVLSLIHKLLTDKNTRSSLPNALSSSFSAKQFRALVNHFSRESY